MEEKYTLPITSTPNKENESRNRNRAQTPPRRPHLQDIPVQSSKPTNSKTPRVVLFQIVWSAYLINYISFATIVRALRNFWIRFYDWFLVFSSTCSNTELFPLVPVPLSHLAKCHVKFYSDCNFFSVVPRRLLLKVLKKYVYLARRFLKPSSFREISNVGLFYLL